MNKPLLIATLTLLGLVFLLQTASAITPPKRPPPIITVPVDAPPQPIQSAQ